MSTSLRVPVAPNTTYKPSTTAPSIDFPSFTRTWSSSIRDLLLDLLRNSKSQGTAMTNKNRFLDHLHVPLTGFSYYIYNIDIRWSNHNPLQQFDEGRSIAFPPSPREPIPWITQQSYHLFSTLIVRGWSYPHVGRVYGVHLPTQETYPWWFPYPSMGDLIIELINNLLYSDPIHRRWSAISLFGAINDAPQHMIRHYSLDEPYFHPPASLDYATRIPSLPHRSYWATLCSWGHRRYDSK